jgi:hypothetical protein
VDLPKGIPVLCLDFDGVLHSYVSGWKGARNIPDSPVDGAIDWLRSLLGCPDNEGIGPRYLDFKVCIFSSRGRYWGGRRAMKKWLRKWGITKYELELIDFPLFKPPAFVILDDRAISFNGVFPEPKELLQFRPWNKK